jgi:thioredoxin-like negative regulator of GroEL
MKAMLCAVVQIVILSVGTGAFAAENENYADAQKATVKSDKPMVVMVGADWCGPCQMMKKTILPQVREHGLFKKVAFAIVNFDRQRELAKKITGGGPIPQLIMFHKTKDGWATKKLVGSQSVEAVEQFIKEGLASNSDKKKTDEEDDSPAPPTPPAASENDEAA